ncbi:unnamed protein product [Blumeria hordei]|uniref:JmjC domain-containing protein n=1 Tax=Blumeria hordei TaxID=2867405 RepID=A0A383US71_BLUHO|nr:unnamed protein product [Blumeria hordei]
MPSQYYPQAQFVPLSPNFELEKLVASSKNFSYAARISIDQLKYHPTQSLEALVSAVVVKGGRPLVIENWGSSLPTTLFSTKWLEENIGTQAENVRDISNETDIHMTVGHYLRSMNQLTKQFTSSNYQSTRRQRLYMKDIDCPDAWAEHLQNILPGCVNYLNDNIDSKINGLKETDEIIDENSQDCPKESTAIAGDLMSSLPPDMRAQNLMCYIGHEGTYTAIHQEMCATLGHNIMVEASKDEGNEQEGSSIWFMTETKEREVVSEYFLSILGHDIGVEKHFAQVNAWKKAPFNVWIVEQKVGDLILIPPLAPHQVWNRGTRTMKVAWNRTTIDTLELAIHEALSRCRMVCRDEQYKCKAIIYYTLVKYHDFLLRALLSESMWQNKRTNQFVDEFQRLFYLYQEIIISEMFSPNYPQEENVEMIPFGYNITCSYCRCDIFNRFLTCKKCIVYGPNGMEDTYDICMDCYAMGRSCSCISNLKWVEQWEWKILEENYELWRTSIIRCNGDSDDIISLQPLPNAFLNYKKKSLAEVCQEQLRIRPCTHENITNMSPNHYDSETESEDKSWKNVPYVKEEFQIVNLGKKRRKSTIEKTNRCHVCLYHHWSWKLAYCSTCTLAYCYGVLWRAFDLMPQTVMENKKWQCPRCLKICCCGKCRKCRTQNPYQQKGTQLGHDTRKVADHRSVEILVDFSKPNMSWLRNDPHNPQDSIRIKRLKEKAESTKSQENFALDNYLVGHDGLELRKNMDDFSSLTANLNYIDPFLRDLTASESISSVK